MKKLLLICFAVLLFTPAYANDKFTSCGEGFVLVNTAKVDGIERAECQKLWCRDLELGRPMGTGDRAAAGYIATNRPMELCDATGKCIECFGDRRWCAGEVGGVWNPEFGAFTKKGDDSNAFLATQRGDCFIWQMQKASCPAGEAAVLINDKWVCAVAGGQTGETLRQSTIRRAGTIRR
ncbi:MAG: hypothetical protein FWE52_00310 [Alphaproteobacteria bacterium]|nr:hypothetical protein [Alphaproteobacteria bacterium]